MKNKLFLMIMVFMVCSLCACGQQETGTMTNTGNSTEQIVASEDPSELATAEYNNMEQTEAKDNWPDVEELVNQRGDETTVYLLADGRYMDRINAVYIYDGKDTWTDESGVEWNKAVKQQKRKDSLLIGLSIQKRGNNREN